MPQKLNPDVAELARGKAGTAIGRLTGLLAVVKGLPLAYDKDLQEDKTPLFATRRDVRGALAALGALIGGLDLNYDRLAAAVSDPLLRATDAAEALVRDGVAFRDAHEQVAAAVRGGTFVAPDRDAPRAAPGPAGVKTALHDARLRLAARALADTTRALVGRDLTTLTTWSAYELRLVLDLAEHLKSAQKNGIEHRLLPGRTLGLIFGRPSTRTRVSFAVAMEQLGGSAVALNTSELQLSRGEPLDDTARVLCGYLDALAVRWPSQADLETLATPRVHPGDQRAHRRRASVPGARGRAHDPRALRRSRRRARRVRRRRQQRLRLAPRRVLGARRRGRVRDTARLRARSGRARRRRRVRRQRHAHRRPVRGRRRRAGRLHRRLDEHGRGGRARSAPPGLRRLRDRRRPARGRRGRRDRPALPPRAHRRGDLRRRAVRRPVGRLAAGGEPSARAEGAPRLLLD